jgi:hypothetical protein
MSFEERPSEGSEAVSGGEARPPAVRRRLERPPAERYAARAEAGDSEAPSAGEAALSRVLPVGIEGAFLVALAMGLLGGLFDLTAGLIVVGLIGGWLIGRAVAGVARGGSLRSWLSGAEPSPGRAPGAVRLVALACGLVAVAGGLVVLWIVSLAAVRDATSGLLDRLAALPLRDWLDPQLGQLGPILLLTLLATLVAAWRASR